MPLDIRSFFAKKPADKNKAKVENTATATETSADSNTKTKPKAATATVTAVSKAKATSQRKQDDVKKVKGFDTSSSDDEKSQLAKPSPKKKLKTSSKNSDDEEEDEEVQAMSASAYFSKTAPTTTKNRKVDTPPGKATRTKRNRSGEKRTRDQKDKNNDDESDEDYMEETAVAVKAVQRSSPRRKVSPPAKEKKTSPIVATPESPKPSKLPILEPTLDKDSFDVDVDAVIPECLQGLTFVLTGILSTLNRDDASNFIKTLGGRVTGSVSGKTSYVIVGDVLEDGRPVEQGKKYQAAIERKIPIVQGESKLYGLCHLYQDLAKETAGIDETKPMTTSSTVKKSLSASTSTPPPPSTVSSKPAPGSAGPKLNPYAKKTAVNPYAKKASGSTAAAATNSYAKKTNPYSKAAPASTIATVPAPTAITVNQLWVDRHAPISTREILGNKENIIKLTTWLSNWERTFNNPKAYNKAFSNPKGPWKAALLSGPPGIGKTTTATLVAKESGRDLREFNASDARSKKSLQQQLGDLTGSHTLGFSKSDTKPSNDNNKKSNKQLRCIIMDEVDGMGAGDRSGMSELIQMIKKSKVPIICICNDRQSQKMKSLLPYCMDLRFKRPVKSVMANRAVRVAQMEGLQVERNAAEAIAESCGNDVRQVLNVLQMWAQDKAQDLTFKNLKDREKSINKDEILRVSLFDAARSIMEGRKGLSGADGKTQRDSLFRRSDAFFVDYSLTGLLVQQNYPKVMQPHYSIVKKADNPAAELTFLNRMYDAAASMSDYAMVEHEIRSGDQNWSLLPTCAMMTVKTGFHAGGKTGGSLNGYPEFTAWMGKNSSKGKKQRILNELHHHMNFKITADSQQLRESYLPVFRDRFYTLFTEDSSDAATDAAIQLMDDYGLSREDVMEKLDEFQVAKQGEVTRFADLDSKQRAAFTRRYNQGSHKSQALIQEEFATSKPKKSGGKREKDPLDLDAIDEDEVEEDESEGEDEEAELRKLREKLTKGKGRKSGTAKDTSKTKAASGKRGRKK